MNFVQEAKIQCKAKTARYDRIINELCHFYKVSLIKTGLMLISFIEPIVSFHEIQKITKMSFNIPLIYKFYSFFSFYWQT